jgi:hypothetical protein
MVEIRQRILISLMLVAPLPLAAQKFYPDDPIAAEPPPIKVTHVNTLDIDAYYDFFRSTFFEPDKKEIKHHDPSPSEAVNTLGEVPDNAWFTNRIGSRPMSVEELVRGAGVDQAPDSSKPWTVISAKNEGVMPGLIVRDGAGRRYFVKFDPKTNPEMASAADVVGAKFCYDMGYFTPQNYIVTFSREQIVVDDKSTFKDDEGHKHIMTPRELGDIISKIPRLENGRYRAMASLSLPGDIIGPHRYYDTRSDDPNDIVAHENRRDQRGLYLLFAWINHTDAKSLNSLDSLVEVDGVKSVRHYLIDFGDSMGSDSNEPKEPWRGHMYAWDPKVAATQFVSLGLYVPAWMRAHYPDIPEIGNFDYRTFDPLSWRANYANIAFELHNSGDLYWAAKKIMAFSDEAIRAIVATGQYSDPRAVEWATRCLIERRNRIGRAAFEGVLPLDNFTVADGRLAFDDLGVKAGFAAARTYTVAWSEFDNQTSAKRPISGATTVEVPRSSAQYLAADIHSSDPKKTVTVYIRRDSVVGIDRAW